MLTTLRQNLTEYAVHLRELETLLMEAFSTSAKLGDGLAGVVQPLEGALIAIDEQPNLQACETSLEQIGVILF